MSRARILVVEDEAVVALDIAARLGVLGYDVVGRADTAAGAVAAAEKWMPDLVLMDIRLKGEEDGIEAAGEVRGRLGLPVVFLTAHADERTLERAKQSEPFGYILKPFEDREVRTVVEMALYKHQADLEIRRLNRLYAVLSRVNRALVGVRAAPAFLEEVCRVAVVTGGFEFAWVGRHEDSGDLLETVGAWGRGAAEVERLPELAADRGPGSPSHAAFRSGKRWVGALEDSTGPLPDCCTAVRRAGLREMAAIPVSSGGVLWGVFAVYSTGPGVFGTREVELLEEVAAAIGFGLEQGVREEERASAEVEIREQRRLFETLLEVIPTPVFLSDTGGCYLRCNEAFARFVGRPKEEILHRSIDEVVPPDLAVHYRRADDALFRQGRGGTHRYTSQVSRRDGTRRDVVFHKASLCDAEGVPCGIVGVILDITDLKDRERELRESERRFRTLIQKSADVVAVLDLEGVILFQSASAERTYGYVEGEVVGLSLYGLAHPEDVRGLRQALVDLIALPGGQVPAVFRLRHRDGSWRWTEATGTNLLHDPEMRGIVVNYRDITARVLAEDEVRHRQAELSAIYESAPFMMCLVDRSGRIVRANRALERLGESGDGHVPRALIDCLARVGSATEVPTGRKDPLVDAVRGTFESGTGRYGVEVALPGGGEAHVSLSTALLEVDRTPLVLVCMEDISRRRRLEAQFLQAQKMEAVGQLAGGIAHDFNNILAAMMMNLGLLRNPARKESDPAECLGELERLAQRAADLTRQLLLFGRRQRLKVVRVDLNGILTGLTRMLKRLLGEHIEVTLSCSAGILWVDVDPGMIEQVVMNLAVNARDAMPQGGKLLLETSRVLLGADGAEDRAASRRGWFHRLRVADTGCGMDAAVLARVFEPFFTTKEVGKGTGLGLATVQGILEQHRGWVEVESQVGAGTNFSVFLPVAVGPPPPGGTDRLERATVAAPVQGGTETILVVEDAPAVRRMVGMTLRTFGYHVIEASQGQEALERWLLDPGGIDLVLTDMVMPGGMSGLDLIRRLRRQRPNLRAVVSSGYSTELVRQGEEERELEGVSYLAKPYRSEALARAVREGLDAVTAPESSGLPTPGQGTAADAQQR